MQRFRMYRDVKKNKQTNNSLFNIVSRECYQENTFPLSCLERSSCFSCFFFLYFFNEQTLKACAVSCCLTSVSIITPSSCRAWVRKNVPFFRTIGTLDSKDDKYHMGFLCSRCFKDGMIAISSLF